jgi:hypothetical protein
MLEAAAVEVIMPLVALVVQAVAVMVDKQHPLPVVMELLTKEAVAEAREVETALRLEVMEVLELLYYAIQIRLQ